MENYYSPLRGEYETLLCTAFAVESIRKAPKRIQAMTSSFMGIWETPEEFRAEVEGCAISAEDEFCRTHRVREFTTEHRKHPGYRRYLQNRLVGAVNRFREELERAKINA